MSDRLKIEGIAPSMKLSVGVKIQLHGRKDFVQVVEINDAERAAYVVPCDPPGANRRERRANQKKAIAAAAQVAREAARTKQ